MSPLPSTAAACATALTLSAVLAASPARAQDADHPIAGLDDGYPPVAWQSSDYREDTGAAVATPSLYETLVVPDATTPAYTRVEPDPWWQVDLRVRRHVSTVGARACEGFADNGAFGPSTGPAADAGPAPIACNTDYDLAGAWVLVSDVPFPDDPWDASVANVAEAAISRFPIVGNGYRQRQLAEVHRPGRYVRIQFPPGTTRAIALEKVEVSGRQGLTDPVVALPGGLDPAFVQTRALLAHLSEYREVAGLVEVELGRLQGTGRKLETLAKVSASVARRVARLDADLGSAISMLDKTALVSQLRTPASAMRRTLATVRTAVRRLKDPANRARDAFERTRSRLKGANRTLLAGRVEVVRSVAWSAVEETAVAGLYHCEIEGGDGDASVPVGATLEGYSGARNARFELTGINARTRDIATGTKAVNDGVESGDDALGALTRLDARLAAVHGELGGLLVPLRDIGNVLSHRICLPWPASNACLSVEDVLRFIRDGKDFLGLSALEDLANSLLEPLFGAILAPLRSAFPTVPGFPAIDVALPDASAPAAGLTDWRDAAASLRELLDTPAIRGCAEAGGTIERADATATGPVAGG